MIDPGEEIWKGNIRRFIAVPEHADALPLEIYISVFDSDFRPGNDFDFGILQGFECTIYISPDLLEDRKFEAVARWIFRLISPAEVHDIPTFPLVFLLVGVSRVANIAIQGWSMFLSYDCLRTPTHHSYNNSSERSATSCISL